MRIRVVVIAVIVGVLIGIGVGLPLKYYVVDPYLTSLLEANEPVVEANVRAIEKQAVDNLRRDQLVVESLAKLDTKSRKAACEGYIGGLKEQGLRGSTDLYSACDGS
jgi:uncharacterized protein YneF (UPF0154 family)